MYWRPWKFVGLYAVSTVRDALCAEGGGGCALHAEGSEWRMMCAMGHVLEAVLYSSVCCAVSCTPCAGAEKDVRHVL